MIELITVLGFGFAFFLGCAVRNKMTQPRLALLERLAAAIRAHRDTRGDDRCWRDDEELYAALPEGFKPPARDAMVEFALCQKYILSRHNPGTVYISPQRRIEELEAALCAIRDGYKTARADMSQSAAPLVIAMQQWEACVETARKALR